MLSDKSPTEQLLIVITLVVIFGLVILVRLPNITNQIQEVSSQVQFGEKGRVSQALAIMNSYQKEAERACWSSFEKKKKIAPSANLTCDQKYGECRDNSFSYYFAEVDCSAHSAYVSAERCKYGDCDLEELEYKFVIYSSNDVLKPKEQRGSFYWRKECDSFNTPSGIEACRYLRGQGWEI